MKKPKPIVDAFAPALARLVGACARSHADAVFATPQPPLATRSPDLVLDGTDGNAATPPEQPTKTDPDRVTRA